MEAKIEEHVQCLSNNENKSDILKSLHELNVIVDSRSIDGERLVSLIPPPVLFNCLTSNNEEEIKICTVLLKKLLNFVKAFIVIPDYEEAAVQGLNHPSEDVREMCLAQVERCIQTVHGIRIVIHTPELVNFVIRSLADSHPGCAKIACSVLVFMGKDPDALSFLLDEDHKAEFQALMSKSDTVRFRVYELFVKIVQSDSTFFSQVRPIFQKIVSEVDSSDVLVQMNCIELLTDIVGFGEAGIQLPEESGVNKKLYGILKEPESNPLSSLLIPAIIKFFGILSMKNPHMVAEKYPLFFQFIFNCILSNDDGLIGISLDTIGAIGSSDVGLNVLFQTEAQRNILSKIGSCLRSSEEQLRVHCLDCLSSLFTSGVESDKNTLDLIHTLYLKLDPNSLELLFKTLKQPFNNIRLPCFKTFYSLVSYQWMLEDIKNIPGFFEYLLDRRTESEKECQEIKYEMVKKMTTSKYAAVVFDKPSMLKLKQFVRDGPFYIGSDVSVAMEGTQ